MWKVLGCQKTALERLELNGHSQENIEENVYQQEDWHGHPELPSWPYSTYPCDPTLNIDPKEECKMPSCKGPADCDCRVQDIKSPLVEVRDYQGKGADVMALMSIPKGVLPDAYLGVLLPADNNENSHFYDAEVTTPIKSAPRIAHISPARYGTWTRYINHSYTPNTRICQKAIGKHRHIVIKSVEAEPIFTEITYDFGIRYWLDRKILCACGSENCKYDTKEKKDALRAQEEEGDPLSPRSMEALNNLLRLAEEVGSTDDSDNAGNPSDLQPPSPIPNQAAKRKRDIAKTSRALKLAKTIVIDAPKAPKGKTMSKGYVSMNISDEEETLPPTKKTRTTRTVGKASGEQSLRPKLAHTQDITSQGSPPAATTAKKIRARKTGAAIQIPTVNAKGTGTASEAALNLSALPKARKPRTKKTTVTMQPATTKSENVAGNGPNSKGPSSTAVSKRGKGRSRTTPVETQRNREDAGDDAVIDTEDAPPTKAPLKRKRRGDTVEAKGKAKEQMEDSPSRQDEKMDPQ